MLTEQKNNTVRNPFIMIGKVFKYEFIATARRLALIYALIPVIALILGLFFRNTVLKIILAGNIDKMSEKDAIEKFLPGILGMYSFTYIFIIIAAISTLIVIYNRFKKGMFGKEAYLNFTLPVSVGEHLCARILSAVAWYFIFSLTMFISFLVFGLCSIDKYINYIRTHNVEIPNWTDVHNLFENEFHCSIAAFFCTMFVAFLITSILFIVFLYMISCVGHLVKKHRMLLQFATIVVCIAVGNIVLTRLFRSFALNAATSHQMPNLLNFMWSMIIPLNLVFTAIYGAVCYLVLRFRLNLE